MMTAQNLVPNGSFEEYTDCPDNWNQVENVIGWEPVAETPDYFNSCCVVPGFDVPLNWGGYQYASQGDGYIGVGTYYLFDQNFREIVITTLDQPLQVGVPVYLSMKVALGTVGSDPQMGPRWTSKGIGMLLTTEPFQWNWPNVTHRNTATLYLEEVLTDSSSWTTLSTYYIPDSAYAHLAIGNFFEDSLSAPVLADTTPGLQGAYVFVDEVCVALDPADCVLWSDIQETRLERWWSYPSLFFDRLSGSAVGSIQGECLVSLYDMAGRCLNKHVVLPGQSNFQLNTSSLSDGPYVIRLQAIGRADQSSVVFHITL